MELRGLAAGLELAGQPTEHPAPVRYCQRAVEGCSFVSVSRDRCNYVYVS